MKIEMDDGKLVTLSEKESLSLCEQAWNGYLRLLNTCKCSLDEETLKRRKDKWFAKWDREKL